MRGRSRCGRTLRPGQQRLRRSIEGPVTREAVTRSLAVVPDDAGEPGGPAEVSLMLRIEFAFDSAELTVRAMRDLDGVASALNDPELTTAQWTLEGHMDATGAEDYTCGCRRTYLAGCGVARARLLPVGFGEDRLLLAFAPTDDRQRRVEIVRTF